RSNISTDWTGPLQGPIEEKGNPMNWPPARNDPRRSSSQQRVRPRLEQLEDRRLLAVTYHGGALLAQVEVEPVFYGPYWNSAAGQQQASDLDNFLSFLTNSSYMDMLQ